MAAFKLELAEFAEGLGLGYWSWFKAGGLSSWKDEAGISWDGRDAKRSRLKGKEQGVGCVRLDMPVRYSVETWRGQLEVMSAESNFKVWIREVNMGIFNIAVNGWNMSLKKTANKYHINGISVSYKDQILKVFDI